MTDNLPVHTMQVPVPKVAWWKLAFNLVNIVIGLVLAFSALLAFVQGYAQNLRLSPPDINHLQGLDVEAIQSSSTSTDVGDQIFFARCYYIAGAVNILTIFRVLFMNAKVVNNLSNKKKARRNSGGAITETISRSSIIGRNSIICKKFVKVDSVLKHFDFDGKYFWYKFLASGTVGVLLQFIRFLTFSGLDILGSPTYVEVKKPFAVISYAFVLSVHLIFGVTMFSLNKKLPAVIIIIVLDFYYAMVPLLNVHGSIFDPSQWYPIRNLNGLEMLAGVVPLILKCGTLQYVSMRNMKRITNQDNRIVADNIHRRSTKFSVSVVGTGLAVSLLLFTLVKHFGADCESKKGVAECHRWSHPIFDDVPCDCVMLVLYLPQNYGAVIESEDELLAEIDKLSRVQYLIIHAKDSAESHNASDLVSLTRVRTKFVLLEGIVYNHGFSTKLDFHHLNKLSVYFSELHKYGEGFDWSLLKTLPYLRYASFAFSRISHWPDVDDVKHVDTLLLHENPVCKEKRPDELRSLTNLKCVVDSVFDVDEQCAEILNAAPGVAAFRAECDKYFESGAPTTCIAPCDTAKLYLSFFGGIFELDYDLDGYYSPKELRTAIQDASFSEEVLYDESVVCLNQKNKGCPHDGEQHVLPFTSIATYVISGRSNCLDCDWAQERLKRVKEGQRILEPDSELTASKPGDVDPEDCKRLLSQDVYQRIIESCNTYHAKMKPQKCKPKCILAPLLKFYPLIDDDGDGAINTKELGTFLKVQNLLSKHPTDATMICLAEKLSECPASKEGPFVSFEALVVFSNEGESGCMECDEYPANLKP